MNTGIPKGREFYLESAKTNPKNQKWVRVCLRNFDRVIQKEWAAAATATQDKDFNK